MNKLLLALSFVSSVAQAATGELWDVKMSMMGMDMPAQQMCMSKDKISEKDVHPDKECHTTSFKSLSNNHVKFTFACNDGSTGDGDIQRDSKKFKQVMNMVQKGEKMTMTSDGANSGQACDPDSANKQAQAAMTQNCENASKEFSAYSVIFPKQKVATYNCDKYKGTYCGLVKSIASSMSSDSKAFEKNAFGENYDAKTAETAGTWKKAVTACGAGNPDAIKKSACKNGVDIGNYSMVNRVCPAETAELNALYKQECVGRNYTANPVSKKYASFCSSYNGGGNVGAGATGDGGRTYTATGKKKKGLADLFKSSKKEEPSNDSASSNSGGSSSGSSNTESSNSGNSNSGSGSTASDALEKAKKLKDAFGF